MKPYVIYVGPTMTCGNFFVEGIGNDVGLDQMYASYQSQTADGPANESWSSLIAINGQTVAVVTPNTCDQQVGLQDTHKSTLRIIPNPAHEKILLSADGATFNKIAIVDMFGKTVMHPISCDISVEDLPAGVYFLRVESASDIPFIAKFVKQ